MTQQIATDRFCTRCDTHNSADAMFCVNCGASLAEHTPAPVQAAAPAQRGPRCRACGVANPAHAAFCVNCGAGLQVAGPAFAPALAGATYGNTIVQHVYVSTPAQAELPLGIRALWFVFVGLWAGQLWLVFAWLMNLTLIGMPLGIWMLSQLPQVMTLRPERRGLQVPQTRSSASFAVRAIYFVLIGWWVSLIWLQLAWIAAATIIGLPLAFLMFERTSTVMTLADS